jgi:hypothetical protein
VRSKNGQSKTARVTNLVFLDSPDPLHLGRVRAARAQIFDDLKKYAGWETEFHQLSLKQAVYGGKNRAEILRNEKADIDRRVKKINEQD